MSCELWEDVQRCVVTFATFSIILTVSDAEKYDRFAEFTEACTTFTALTLSATVIR